MHPGNPDRPAMIMELKKNDSAGNALKQIHDRQYFEPLKEYCGKILFVGINYDERTKEHTAQTEWFLKE